MKEQCEHCKEVFSITSSPNNIEGYFVTEDVIEEMDEEMDFPLGFIKAKCSYGVKCPKCKKITILRNS